jgi:hypothetical protein
MEKASLSVALVNAKSITLNLDCLNGSTLETALELMLIDEQESQLPGGGDVCASVRGGDTDNDEDELTPRPQKRRHQHLVEPITDDDDHFQTPVALIRKRRVVVESEDSAASEDEHYPKYERRYKHEKKDSEAVIHRGDQQASGGEKKERKVGVNLSYQSNYSLLCSV